MFNQKGVRVIDLYKYKPAQFVSLYFSICHSYFGITPESAENDLITEEVAKMIEKECPWLTIEDLKLSFSNFLQLDERIYVMTIQSFIEPIRSYYRAKKRYEIAFERLTKEKEQQEIERMAIEKEKTDFINNFPQSFLDAEPNVKYKMSDLILDNFNVFVPDQPTLDEITKRATEFRKQKLAEVEAGSFDYFPWSLQSVINAFIIGFNLKSNWGYERKDI